jgi:hypothetical protein
MELRDVTTLLEWWKATTTLACVLWLRIAIAIGALMIPGCAATQPVPCYNAVSAKMEYCTPPGPGYCFFASDPMCAEAYPKTVGFFNGVGAFGQGMATAQAPGGVAGPGTVGNPIYIRQEP